MSDFANCEMRFLVSITGRQPRGSAAPCASRMCIYALSASHERIDQLADEEEALAKLTPDWPGGSAFPGPSHAMVPR